MNKRIALRLLIIAIITADILSIGAIIHMNRKINSLKEDNALMHQIYRASESLHKQLERVQK